MEHKQVPEEFAGADAPPGLAALLDGNISDYGDPGLSISAWDEMYPCPVTGCWLTTSTDQLEVDRWCGQPDCFNPAHFRRHRSAP